MKTQAVNQTINAKDLAGEEEFYLVDVRTPMEFREKHIPGSSLHPLHQLDAKEIMEKAKGRKICCICQSGSRSEKALQHFAEGNVEAVSLEGGISSWEEAGQPLNRGQKGMSLERQVRIGAGSLVLLGVLGTLFIHPLFLALSGFVGAGLIFAGLTDWCGMGMLLARMPWNQDKKSCCNESGEAEIKS